MHRTGGRFFRGYVEKIREQIEQLIWFTEYEDEIICDLAAIYGILDPKTLSGPDFVRFARNLIYYQGAVAGKMKVDYMDSNPDSELFGEQPSEGKKIRMSDAMAELKGDEFTSLNYESQSNGLGDLFERVTVPGN